MIQRRYNIRVRLTFDERRVLEKMCKASGEEMSTVLRRALAEMWARHQTEAAIKKAVSE